MPSLVPLIFSLIIFFSTFTYAMNSMDSRDDDFDADLATLNIARIVRSNGYITDHNDFARLCDMINVAGLNYEVALIDTNLTYKPENYDSREYEGVNIFDLRIFDSTPSNADDQDASEFLCTNLPEVPSDFSRIAQRLSSRAFPIVLEDANIAKPMFLVVITWKP